MKVALVQAPVWWPVDPPLGLAQIAGCASAAGHEVLVSDLNIQLWKNRPGKYENLWLWEQYHFWNDPKFVAAFFKDNAAIVEAEVQKILSSDSRVVGFSVYLGAQWASLEMARLIKKADPSRIIVWGGQFFFLGTAATEWIERPEIDAIVRGHGDVTFPRLLDAVERTGKPAPMPGVVLKAGGAVVDGGPPASVNLEKTPFADLRAFPMELYSDPIRIPFAGSRGCVWKCHFCSSTNFWSGYTYMSGERMFAEVMHHRSLLPGHQHVEFYDITANGDVSALRQFSRLTAAAIKADHQKWIGWKINAIIRPEMTPEVLADLRAANCHDIIYGIESGSPKVLKMMNKPFQPEIADRVLKDTHDAGIKVTANIMFGFPGETEQDFDMTLDFLKRNAGHLDRVYGSATFTSLEENSRLTENQEASGIKKVSADRFHNLYWETEDGTNDYEVRLNRYRRFRQVAIGLGIDAYKGVNGNLEQDHLANLAQYKEYRCDHLAAIDEYLKYLENDLYSGPMRAKLADYRENLKALAAAQRAVEKANHVLKVQAGVAQEFLPWAEPHLNNGGLPAVDGERSGGFHLSAALLNRARTALLSMPEERRAGMHLKDGKLSIIWIEKTMPSYAELRRLSKRVEMILALAESEIARGEDKKEAPRCQR